MFDNTSIMGTWGAGNEAPVHRLDKPAWFTPREVSLLILLAGVLAFAVGFA